MAPNRRQQAKKRPNRANRPIRKVAARSPAPASSRASAQDQQNATPPLPGHDRTSQPSIISLIATYIIDNPDGPDVVCFHCCFQRSGVFHKLICGSFLGHRLSSQERI